MYAYYMVNSNVIHIGSGVAEGGQGAAALPPTLPWLGHCHLRKLSVIIIHWLLFNWHFGISSIVCTVPFNDISGTLYFAISQTYSRQFVNKYFNHTFYR